MRVVGVAPSLVFSPGTTSVASAANVSPGASAYWQQRGSAASAITFANTTDAAVTLDYAVQAFAYASEDPVPVTAVDEPGWAWLLLAGASPPAWAARRRKLSAGRRARRS